MHLTIREVATLLNISERAVRLRIERGSLVAHKRAGRWVIARDALADEPTERRAHVAKADRIRSAVEAGLGRSGPTPVTELQPFRVGLQVAPRSTRPRIRSPICAAPDGSWGPGSRPSARDITTSAAT